VKGEWGWGPERQVVAQSGLGLAQHQDGAGGTTTIMVISADSVSSLA
jgi:hypothetical protein